MDIKDLCIGKTYRQKLSGIEYYVKDIAGEWVILYSVNDKLSLPVAMYKSTFLKNYELCDKIVDVELCVLGSGTLAYLTDDGKIVTPEGIIQCNPTFIRTGTNHKFNKTKNKFVEI